MLCICMVARATLCYGDLASARIAYVYIITWLLSAIINIL